MFILTAVNTGNNMASVYDTSDNTNERIVLNVLAKEVCKGTIKVYGIARSGTQEARTEGSVQISNLGVSINITTAKEALARHYAQCGMPVQVARAKVGLPVA